MSTTIIVSRRARTVESMPVVNSTDVESGSWACCSISGELPSRQAPHKTAIRHAASKTGLVRTICRLLKRISRMLVIDVITENRQMRRQPIVPGENMPVRAIEEFRWGGCKWFRLEWDGCSNAIIIADIRGEQLVFRLRRAECMHQGESADRDGVLQFDTQPKSLDGLVEFGVS